MSRKAFSRRSFMGACAAGTAAARLAAGAAGAGDRVNLGFIGTGGRGGFHLAHFKSLPDTGLLGVCDVDARHLNAAAQTAGPGVLKTMDYREILDRKDIDAVVISTPDHWHAIPALRAMEAGKDVYVEKPLGHNIAEGRAIVAAAEAGKRIVQIGLQQRSGPHFIEAVRRIRAGELGKVSCVHAWNAWSTTGMGGDLGADHLVPVGQQPRHGKAPAFAGDAHPLRQKLRGGLETAHPAPGLSIGFVLGHPVRPVYCAMQSGPLCARTPESEG